MQVFLVGGAVRDSLLGLPVTERDWVVVGATVAQMRAAGYQQVGKDFPVFLHPQTKEEYALARTERKAGHGYKGFEFYAQPEVSLEQDLERRDLTINAMAQDAQGNLIDPYGGQRDLAAKLLRHVSPAFAEDPLRVLRVARFAARFHGMGFTLAPETLQLMRDIVAAGEVQYLVAERVWTELVKALRTTAPQVFFETLRACGALRELLPELDRLFGVPQTAVYHPEIDTGVHTLMVLAQAAKLSGDPLVLWGALLHDLGKGVTPPEQWPSHHGHEAHSERLVAEVGKRLRAPKDYTVFAKLVARHHGLVHKVFELRPGTILDLLDQLDVWRRPERLEPFLLACEADSRGRTGFETREFPQRAFLAEVAARCAQVNAKPFMARGLAGLELAEAIRVARLAIISELKKGSN